MPANRNSLFPLPTPGTSDRSPAGGPRRVLLLGAGLTLREDVAGSLRASMARD